MKRITGIISMVLGGALIIAAAVLVIYNRQEEETARGIAEEYLPQIIDRISREISEEPEAPSTESPDNEASSGDDPSADSFSDMPSAEEDGSVPENAHDKANSYVSNMLVTEIDGYSFVGYVSIPKLGVQLPVMSETRDELLKISPCRFSGSPKTDDLVIGAHNYDVHFGNIQSLSQGDEVIFADMEGKVWTYTALFTEILSPDETDMLSSGEYPLTLYTCNYDGGQRIVLRCETQTQKRG